MSRASRLATIGFCFIAIGAIPARRTNLMLAPAALGQNIGQRTVSGTVLSASSEAVAGATVFLKNEKTKAIRSYMSTAGGHYRFSQVDMSVDFDLWAEKDSKKSATRTVSSWDDRKEFVLDLKLK